MSNFLLELKRVFQAEVEVLRAVERSVQPNFEACIDMLLGTAGKLVITGVGKSGIIAHKIAATLSSTGTPAIFLNAGEASHGDLGMVSKDDCVVMLSNSGSTPELIQLMPSIKEIGARCIGWFGRTDTALAQQCDLCLHLEVSREACPLNLAPMSSATAALVLGDAVASVLMRVHNFSPEQFAINHPGGALGRKLLLRVSDVMHSDNALPRVSQQASLKECVLAITEGKLGAVCVTDEAGKLLGIITDGDIRRQLMGDVDLAREASAIMTRQPIKLSPDMKLGEALDLMENRERQIYVAPVVDADGRVIGMLRMHDIVGG